MTGKLHWARKIGNQASPGPGAYNLPSCFGSSSPRFSIKRRYKEKETESCPEFLDIKPRNDSPRFTIRPRTTESKDAESPGPSYVPPPLGAQKIRTNHPKRGENRGSAREKRYESYDKSINGPAEFNLSKPCSKHSLQITVGKRLNMAWLEAAEATENPSPDTYDPDITLTRPSSPRYSLRASPKVPVHDVGPGPACVAIPSEFGKRATSIHIRHKKIPGDETPGPGEYEIREKIGHGKRAATISPRIDQRYYCQDTIDELIKLPSIFSNHHKTTIGERQEIKIRPTPGPGDYEILPIRDPISVCLSPKPTKKDIEERELLKHKIPDKGEEPSPATYHPYYDKTGPSSPRFSFGEKGSFQLAVDTKDNGIPGPIYDPVDKSGYSPKFTMKGRNFPKEPHSETLEADFNGFLEPTKGHSFTIGRREEIDLIPN